MRRCETCIMTRQRRCTYSWTTNGGERGYIFMFLGHAVCIISSLFFFCNNIGFLLLGRCMVNTLAWKVGREKVWAKVFLLLFSRYSLFRFLLELLFKFGMKNFYPFLVYYSLFSLFYLFYLFLFFFFAFIIWSLDVDEYWLSREIQR